MIDRLIKSMVQKARSERVVVSQPLEGGLRLLAYPVDTGALVGIGFDADLAHRVRPEKLLRMRSENPARFGEWLPALLMDGSCYLVRRITLSRHDSDEAILSSMDWQAAQELLS
jgi:hypothetical protein